MSQQEHIAQLEKENRHLKKQLTRLNSHPMEDLVPRDVRLLTELEHFESLGKNIPNGCLFRCHIEAGKLEDFRKEHQWLNHIYLSFASSSWEKLCNISMIEVMQDITLWLMKIYPIDRMNVFPSLYKSLVRCSAFNTEVRYYYSDAETRWLQIMIQPFRDGIWVVCNGFILDVTDRKHVENNLIAEKKRLQMLGNNLPYGVLYRLVFNRVTMKTSMEYVSSTWERITGISPYSVVEDIQAFHDIIHPDDLPYLLEATEMSKQTTTVFEVEIRINYKGNVRWLHISSQPYKVKEMVIWDGIMTDITRRKKVENELEKHREELESLVKERTEELILYQTSLEQMVEDKTHELTIAKEKAEESDRLKSAFLANMSHEVRTPLNAISSLLNILAGDTQLPGNIREYIDVITSNSEQLLKLIDDILDTAKIEAGQMIIRMESFCIDDFMDQMAIFFSQYLLIHGKAHINIENVKINAGKCIVSTDPIRLMQIMHNLISNAIKFTENGHIHFGYRVMDANMLEFFVEDTGIGIPEDHLDTIFQSFRQLELGNNRRYGGTGLGLHISRSLAQLMGGDMYVKSTKGNGSTFFFTIAYNPL